MDTNRFENCDRYMMLKIFVEDDSLKQEYVKSVSAHNSKMEKSLYDAGFDIFSPINYEIDETTKLHKLDFKVICAAEMVLDNNRRFNTGFYMYPRSSLSKSKLRLANSVGIIDSGYRGNLIGMFDVSGKMMISTYDRLLQICAPYLCPIYVEIVEAKEDLGVKTDRGSGGFGSTGR
jgi:dUTPase